MRRFFRILTLLLLTPSFFIFSAPIFASQENSEQVSLEVPTVGVSREMIEERIIIYTDELSSLRNQWDKTARRPGFEKMEGMIETNISHAAASLRMTVEAIEPNSLHHDPAEVSARGQAEAFLTVAGGGILVARQLIREYSELPDSTLQQ